jgi:hypothetical protein
MAHMPCSLETFIEVRSRPFLIQSLSFQCASVLNNSIKIVDVMDGIADETNFSKVRVQFVGPT